MISFWVAWKDSRRGSPRISSRRTRRSRRREEARIYEVVHQAAEERIRNLANEVRVDELVEELDARHEHPSQGERVE